MKKGIHKFALLCAMAFTVSGCATPIGKLADITYVPQTIADCDRDDATRNSLHVLSAAPSALIGTAFDIVAVAATSPIAAASGKAVIDGTRAARDAKCAELRAAE